MRLDISASSSSVVHRRTLGGRSLYLPRLRGFGLVRASHARADYPVQDRVQPKHSQGRFRAGISSVAQQPGADRE